MTDTKDTKSTKEVIENIAIQQIFVFLFFVLLYGLFRGWKYCYSKSGLPVEKEKNVFKAIIFLFFVLCFIIGSVSIIIDWIKEL